MGKTSGVSESRSKRRHELNGVLLGGLVTTLALFATVIAVGRVGSFEALRLIEAVLSSAHFLASTVIAAAMTVLALLLTLTGLSLNSDIRFNPRLYTRARHITTLSVVCIVVGVLLLLAVGVPIAEVEDIRPFYAVMYYLLAGGMAVLGGLAVSMALLIGATLRGLIEIGHPEGASDLLDEEESAFATEARADLSKD